MPWITVWLILLPRVTLSAKPVPAPTHSAPTCGVTQMQTRDISIIYNCINTQISFP